MRNIKINEAESIFEPFWETLNADDCLSVFKQYRIETRGIAEFVHSWGVQIKIFSGDKTTDLPVTMERDCKLNINGYDRMKIFAGIDTNMHFKMVCCIDGVDRIVYDLDGLGARQEYVSEITGSCISKIRMEFQDTTGAGAIAQLIWIGLSNSVKEHEMLTEESPYTADWEGFFTDKPVATPQLGLYFDHGELEQLREKIQQPGFSRWMEKIRESAQNKMSIVPENEVGKFVLRPDRRFCRDRDMKRPDLIRAMDVLAFVGLVDENEDMLRMACRMALAVCHCQYFYESELGVFPGKTWHHACFTEVLVCTHLVKVLDWAGGYLSERGKDLIYCSILRKGLPEIELVMNTQEYVRYCNQGPIFACSLLTIFAALQKKWPRYGKRMAEVEKDLFEMWENYVFSDGGSSEGPGYWAYTMTNIIDALYLLSRIYNKPLQEYIPELVVKSGMYASSVQSEVGNSYLPINDCAVGGQFETKIIQFLARINAGDIWKVKNNYIIDNKFGGIIDLIYGQRYEISEEPVVPELIHMEASGITTLKRKTTDLGTVALYALSSSTPTGHAHADRGSFILEANNKPLLIDRGKCDYSHTYQPIIGKAEVHNVLAGVRNGRFLSQGGDRKTYYGKILKAEYENGNFEYATDSAPAWVDAFERNIRSISSPNPYLYVIEDDVKLNKADSACFILNTYGTITQEGDDYIIVESDIKLTITTKNWKPSKVEMGECGIDGKERPVNRLCLHAIGAEEYRLVTEIKLCKI